MLFWSLGRRCPVSGRIGSSSQPRSKPKVQFGQESTTSAAVAIKKLAMRQLLYHQRGQPPASPLSKRYGILRDGTTRRFGRRARSPAWTLLTIRFLSPIFRTRRLLHHPRSGVGARIRHRCRGLSRDRTDFESNHVHFRREKKIRCHFVGAAMNMMQLRLYSVPAGPGILLEQTSHNPDLFPFPPMLSTVIHRAGRLESQ